MGFYSEAGIVHGFLVKSDEITEEFADEHWEKLIYLDCYYDDGDFIWSIAKLSPTVDWGGAIALAPFEETFDLTYGEYEKRIKEFEELFPNRKGEKPQNYLYNRIS